MIEGIILQFYMFILSGWWLPMATDQTRADNVVSHSAGRKCKERILSRARLDALRHVREAKGPAPEAVPDKREQDLAGHKLKRRAPDDWTKYCNRFIPVALCTITDVADEYFYCAFLLKLHICNKALKLNEDQHFLSMQTTSVSPAWGLKIHIILLLWPLHDMKSSPPTHIGVIDYARRECPEISIDL